MDKIQVNPQPYLIEARAQYPCPHCRQPLKSVFRPPDGTSNWLLFTIALILTPFLVGIIFWIIYYAETKKQAQTHWWHCESCGWRGASYQNSRYARVQPTPAKPLPAWFKVVLVAALVAVIGALLYARQPSSEVKTVNADAKPTATPTPKSDLATLQDEYQALLDKEFPSMNWIKVKYSGSGKHLRLYGYHPYFSQYTLALGSDGPAIGSWVSSNESRLKAAGIVRVGISGSGAYASGVHFDVK